MGTILEKNLAMLFQVVVCFKEEKIALWKVVATKMERKMPGGVRGLRVWGYISTSTDYSLI